MDIIQYGGWKKNARLSNGSMEIVVTGDVGPRVIHCGFVGQKNLFAQFKDQMGKHGEKEWMIRGGHRLWIAPEQKPLTYELDNKAVEFKAVKGGLKTLEEVGSLSHCQKTMTITMSDRKNEVTLVHEIANRGRKAMEMAPWALTVMAPGGMAIIPLPKKIAHTAQVLPNQEWTLWGYTDFTDSRFRLGSRYVFFSQDRKKGPNKLGLLEKEGWVAYVLGSNMFVKTVEWKAGVQYPDGGVNFETFSNEAMLEVETLGPLVTLKPGQVIRHVEKWYLFDKVPFIRTEADADKYVTARVKKCL